MAIKSVSSGNSGPCDALLKKVHRLNPNSGVEYLSLKKPVGRAFVDGQEGLYLPTEVDMGSCPRLTLDEEGIMGRRLLCKAVRCISPNDSLGEALIEAYRESQLSNLRDPAPPRVLLRRAARWISPNHPLGRALINAYIKSILGLRDKNGNTALHIVVNEHAEHNENEKFVQLLIEARADLAQQNKRGLTPLRCALRNGSLSIVRRLFAAMSLKGINQEANKKNTAFLHYAEILENEEIVDYIRTTGIKRAFLCGTLKNNTESSVFKFSKSPGYDPKVIGEIFKHL